MKREFDLVWLSIFRVEDKYSSTSLSLAKELANTNRVFFIDNPVTIGEYLSDKVKRLFRKHTKTHNQAGIKSANFVHIVPFVSLSINWLPKGTIYNISSIINNWIFDLSVRLTLRKYKVRNYIFVNVFNPFYGRTLAFLPAAKLRVYYSVDNMEHSPYIKKHGPFLERKIVSKYELALATSIELKLKLSSYKENVEYLPNAADTEVFKLASTGNLTKPTDINSISRPIIIYTGHIDWRVDLNLIRYVANSHSDKVLLLVGPISLSKIEIDSLKDFDNLLFVGSKPLHHLPNYLCHSVCAIIPFKHDEITKSIYPLKINEYLAAGIPVVSTCFSPDIELFRDVISLENDYDAFSKSIDKEIDSNTTSRRIQRVRVAESNSWNARAQQFKKLIVNHLDLRLK